MLTVAIISPGRSLGPINKVINDYEFGCRFNKYIYKELSDIDKIYGECRDSCDVIFFSGELGYHYIKKRFPDIRVPCAFTAYGAKDVLSILLNFKSEHPDIPLNRVYVDFLTPMNNYMDIHKYIKEEYMPYCYESTTYDYGSITEHTRALWESGKIDFVISRCINNLPTLDALCIPYLAVFPTEEMIKESIETAINNIRLHQLQPMEFLTILIRLPFAEDCPQEEREYRRATLYKMLVDFRRKHDYHFSISVGIKQFGINAAYFAQSVQIKNLRNFILQLQESLTFPFRVGIGLNSDEDRSLYFAERALLEAVRHDADDGFLICNSDETLTGPLSSASIPTYSYADERIADLGHRLCVNEANLLKLIGLFRADSGAVLTAESTSRLLNIKYRSANRILFKLGAEGLIVPCNALHSEEHKGRPRRYYRFVPSAILQYMPSGN